METGSKLEMTITARSGRISLWEKVDDLAFLQPLFEIYESGPLSMGELIAHAFKRLLKSREGQDILAIIQGRKEIAAGDWHDMDDVLAELEAIIRGEDPGDG